MSAAIRISLLALLSGSLFTGCAGHPALNIELGNEKGHLVIIGGGSRPERVMRKFADLAKLHASGRIIVIPDASAVPLETGPQQAAEIANFTDRKVDWFHVTPENLNEDATLAFFDDAGGIFFSGGVQTRLTGLLNGSKLIDKIREIYRNGGVIAGTSAGAAIQSRIMLTGDERRYQGDDVLQRIEAENIVTTEGFGFIRGVIVDQHFVKRSRHNRLISLVLENPDHIGIGIDEQTAVVRYPDNTLEVIGNSQALIYDATEAVVGGRGPETHVLSGRGIRFHVLVEGDRYDLKNRRVIQ